MGPTAPLITSAQDADRGHTSCSEALLAAPTPGAGPSPLRQLREERWERTLQALHLTAEW